VSIRPRKDSLTLSGPLTVNYEVTNMHVGAGKNLIYPLTMHMDVKPKQ